MKSCLIAPFRNALLCVVQVTRVIGRAPPHLVMEPFPVLHFTALRLPQGHKNVVTTKDDKRGCNHEYRLHAPQDASEQFKLALSLKERFVFLYGCIPSRKENSPLCCSSIISVPTSSIAHTYLSDLGFSSTVHLNRVAAGSCSALETNDQQ